MGAIVAVFVGAMSCATYVLVWLYRENQRLLEQLIALLDGKGDPQC